MAAIDVGGEATDRAGNASDSWTFLGLDNPANDTGIITDVEIWAFGELTGCKVGTFFGTAPDYTPRDSAVLGTIAAGSKQTSSGLSIDVQTGDLIGIFFSGGSLEQDEPGGIGVYRLNGDQFAAGQQTYTLGADRVMSLKGIGTTSVGWAGGDIGEVPIATIAKINGVALADILKVNGVA